MSLQLLIDIGLFLLYLAIFTYLLAVTWKFWMMYVNTSYLQKLSYDYLEIKLPREINKSPMAAEIFLRALIEGGGLGNWMKENWNGAMPVVSSVEIVSFEGVIKFFVRIEKKIRPRVEAAIYSQYPTVEIIEWNHDYMFDLPRYVHNAPENPAIWGCGWKLNKTSSSEIEDKKVIKKIEYSGDMYPIKTYIDWGLDKDPKEIYKHDPLTYLLEQFGSIGKGEYMCHQIIFRDALKWDKIYSIKGGESGKTIKDLAKIEMDKYKKKLKEVEDKETGEKKIEEISLSMLEREEDAKRNVQLIQRKMNKPLVIAYMRTLYLADKMKDGRVPMIGGLMKAFNEEQGFNIIGANMGDFPDPYDYPWQDRKKMRSGWNKENLYEGYVARAGLFSFTDSSKKLSKVLDYSMFKSSSYKRWLFEDFWNSMRHPFTSTMNLHGFTLNVEELATLYHFPGEVAATPTLPRIDSVKSSQPANLPMES